MASTRQKPPRIPPRWIIRSAWWVHRAIYRVSNGRKGLGPPKSATDWGTLNLTTIGRKSGNPHNVILGYFEDGPNLVTLAMNGWGNGHPAWWLNLLAHPDVDATLAKSQRPVHARAAQGEERDRLWARWNEINADMDAFAAMRSTETVVVVLEPRAPS